MAKQPPKELIRQLELIAEAIESLNSIIDSKKIKVENYDKEFIGNLTKIRSKALELRSDLEVFKHELEMSLTRKYYNENSRFASTEKVMSEYLMSDFDF